MEIIHVLYPGLNGFAPKQWNIILKQLFQRLKYVYAL